MAHLSRPATRGGFHVAIICALPREADAIMLLFDEFWDEDGDPYGRADGDTNTYITGRIKSHHVVLVILPGMGTASAAAATASLRSSYGALKLAFLVGICGAVPSIEGFETSLGDVIVSSSIIQYDYGRQYPGSFAVKDTIDDSLGRASKEIRGLLAIYKTETGLDWLMSRSTSYLEMLQSVAKKKRRRADYRYPGSSENRLFQPDYAHTHRTSRGPCPCGSANLSNPVCTAPCADVGCDEAKLVIREFPTKPIEDYSINIFIGRVGSGNSVMKSGEDRDRIAAEHGIVAFEMEGAGAWEEVPCIVVKGVADYADSHKSKRWQDFAAATAASVMRGLLERFVLNDGLRPRGASRGAGARSAGGDGGRSVSNNLFGNNVQISQGDVYGSGGG